MRGHHQVGHRLCRISGVAIAAAILLSAAAYCADDMAKAKEIADAVMKDFYPTCPARYECQVKVSALEKLFDSNMLVGPIRPVCKLEIGPGEKIRMALGLPGDAGKKDAGGPLKELTSENAEKWLTFAAQPLHPNFFPNLLQRMFLTASEVTISREKEGKYEFDVLDFHGMEAEIHNTMRMLRIKFWIDESRVIRRIRLFVNRSPLPPLMPPEGYPDDVRTVEELILSLDLSYGALKLEGGTYRVLTKVNITPLVSEKLPPTSNSWNFSFSGFKLLSNEHCAVPAKPKYVAFPKAPKVTKPSTAGNVQFGKKTDRPLNDEMLEKLAKAAPKEEFTFAAMADPHGLFEVADEVLKDISTKGVEFCVVLGDCVGRGAERASHEKYVEKMRAQPFPVISLPGNHDVFSTGRGYFRHYIGKEYFYFDYGSVRVVCLDNSMVMLPQTQIEWMKGALKTDKKKFVCMHCPPMLDDWWPHAFYLGWPEFYAAVMDAGVSGVMAGHAHVLGQTKKGNTKFMMLGASGPLAPPVPTGASTRGYALIKVGKDGCDMEFKRVNVANDHRWGIPDTDHKAEGY